MRQSHHFLLPSSELVHRPAIGSTNKSPGHFTVAATIQLLFAQASSFATLPTLPLICDGIATLNAGDFPPLMSLPCADVSDHMHSATAENGRPSISLKLISVHLLRTTGKTIKRSVSFGKKARRILFKHHQDAILLPPPRSFPVSCVPESLAPFTMTDVHVALRRLKPHKVPEPENVSVDPLRTIGSLLES